MPERYDYIIIGAGSAGCVLANRLSADPSNRVLLLEDGGDNKRFMVTIPKGMAKLAVDPAHCWNYPVVDDSGATVETWQRGRGLGGSSAINGLIYVRGQPADYAAWEREAGPEWGWPAMRAAFRRIEDHELGDDGLRGVGGPLRITPNKLRYPLADKVIAAGQQMGLPLHLDDLNREDLEGIGYYAYNIRDGRRESAANVFLDPVRKRANLRIETHVHVDRLTFEGTRATGVLCRRRDRELRFEGEEIILSAGTINSPKLLQLSGIGPADLLRAQGIPVLADSPDVGRRILEHMGVMLTYAVRGIDGIGRRFSGLGLAGSVLQYLAFRSGPLANGAVEVGGFYRTNAAEPRPNAQLYMSGWTLDIPESGQDVVVPLQRVNREPGMTLATQLIDLESEAAIEITDADPRAPLRIKPDWLGTERDRRSAIDAVRYMRALVTQPALAPYVERETLPGPEIRSDADILAALRGGIGYCGTHAVRSCRMGRDDRAVVDERMRVRGVQGLRVVDCSIMPGLISGNTNGPAMAAAWRAADLILQDGAVARRVAATA